MALNIDHEWLDLLAAQRDETRPALATVDSTDDESRYSFNDYVSWFSSAFGSGPMLAPQLSMAGSNEETIGPEFSSMVQSVGKEYGVVASAVFARQLLLSQIRFVFRGTRLNTEPGKLVGGRGLAPLEHPGRYTRPGMLKRAEAHISYAGNAYFRRDGRDRMHLMRPDWVTLMLGSDLEPDNPGWAEDAEIVAYAYQPGGPAQNRKHRIYMADTVAHWAPEPDPDAMFRGQSWVQSVLTEVQTDKQAATHLRNYFRHAATPQMVFSFAENLTPEQLREFAEAVNSGHAGAANAYKNLFLAGGADAKVVGASLSDLSLRDLQGGLETRVASRSRVPAVVLGIREGLAGSSLNSGNYSQTRRLWADGWFTPTVQELCAVLDPLIDKPGNKADLELWHDSSDVLFLQEDRKDAADIASTMAAAVRQLVDGGYEPDAAVDAVWTGDFGKLTGAHTGKLSVQLQEPGTQTSGDDSP